MLNFNKVDNYHPIEVSPLTPRRMDGAESVRSGRSDRSERSHRSHSSHHSRHHRHRQHGSSTHSQGHRGRSSDRVRDDRSVTIQTPGNGSDVDSRIAESEKIEVQILPQDDNWGDNTTAYTGNTSETGFSMDDMRKFAKENFDEDNGGFDCCRYLSTGLAAILSLLGFFSPIAMVVLPRLKIGGWETTTCTVECEGLLISMAFKLLILLIGTVALFFHAPRATMPRVFVFRIVVLFLVFVLTFAFWLFYGVKIMQEKEPSYYSIVQFSVHLVDALLFIHYIAIILLIIRQIQPQFVIHVVRSPDGESHTYTLGHLSIQRASVWILEQYYKDFQVFNPYLENVMKKPMKVSGLKFYEVDGVQQPNNHARSRAMFAAAARRRDASHNDRFYEEQEYDRRVRKRRARLVTAAEEAFTHIKRMQDENGPAIAMDPQEAAQAVFPSMARPLQKYLRVTRQQPRYTMESVLSHLATCISHDLNPKAFIERYLTQGVVIMNSKDYKDTQKWVLVCDQLLTREIEHGTIFQLRQNDVSLLCSVRKLPHFNITEEVIDPKSNKFVLRLNSETSV
ncbi:vang-like protein 2 isoform X1 [Ruditapes philippinarum]|uniref:vang-like protein 2 isoform X1 n=2 Tax=Ruditapes philippinarum TaxID=129788 RepID=UPI00295B35FE|nr:vang-like protein 2 isoform X1 [Ruditapes philippinarum]